MHAFNSRIPNKLNLLVDGYANMLTMPIFFFILGVYLNFSMGLKETMASL